MTDISIVVPVYNSAAFLAERMRMLSEFMASNASSYELIAVDDASTDESASILHKLQLPNFAPVFLERNSGKFGALAAGIARSRGNCCLFTDADVPYELSAIPYMSSLIRDHGFHAVIGDRTLPGSHYRADLTPIRKLTTVAFTFFVRVFVTGGLYDTQCGLKAFRGDAARALFPLLRERGFAGDVELLYIALKYNLSIRRIPARLQFQGASTVRPLRDGAAMLRTLFKIRSRYKKGLYQSPELQEIARQDYWK